MIDLRKLGLYWYKIDFMLKDYSIKRKMLDFFRRHPSITYAYETIGGADLEVELEVESYEKFREILDQIKERFGTGIESYQHPFDGNFRESAEGPGVLTSVYIPLV